jgi:hypothetical protein
VDAGIPAVDVAASFELARYDWNNGGGDVVVHGADIGDPEDRSVNAVWLQSGSDANGAVAAATNWYRVGEEEFGSVACSIDIYSQWYDPEFGYDEGYVRWSLSNTDGAISTSEFSLPAVLMHEIGHCLGIGDNAISGTLMYVSRDQGQAASLTLEDRLALDYLYP